VLRKPHAERFIGAITEAESRRGEALNHNEIVPERQRMAPLAIGENNGGNLPRMRVKQQDNSVRQWSAADTDGEQTGAARSE